MHNVAPAPGQVGRNRPPWPAFLPAVVSLVAASATPIPLFNTYRAEDRFTNADTSPAVVLNSRSTSRPARCPCSAQCTGSSPGGRDTPATAQRLGVIAFLAAIIGLITAIAIGALSLFIAATVVAGLGRPRCCRAAGRGSMRTI